jgi:hypothetical protein
MKMKYCKLNESYDLQAETGDEGLKPGKGGSRLPDTMKLCNEALKEMSRSNIVISSYKVNFDRRVAKKGDGWRSCLLATAALWVRIQTFHNNTKWGT